MVVVDIHRAAYVLLATLSSRRRPWRTAGSHEFLPDAGNNCIVAPAIGLSALEMTAIQRVLLVDSIERWGSIQPSENTQHRMGKLGAGLEPATIARTGANGAITPTHMITQAPQP